MCIYAQVIYRGTRTADTEGVDATFDGTKMTLFV